MSCIKDMQSTQGRPNTQFPLLALVSFCLCHSSCDVFPNDPKMFFSLLYCLSWARLGVKDKPGLELGWNQVWLITSHSCKEYFYLSTSLLSFSTLQVKFCSPWPYSLPRKFLQWIVNSTGSITPLFKSMMCYSTQGWLVYIIMLTSGSSVWLLLPGKIKF